MKASYRIKINLKVFLCSDDNGDVSSIDDNRDTNSDCDDNGDGGDW